MRCRLLVPGLTLPRIIATFAIGCSEGEPISVRLSLEEGTQVKCRMHMTQSGRMKGTPLPLMCLDLQQDLTFAILGMSGDDTHRMEIRYGRIRGTTRMMGGVELSFDSEKEPTGAGDEKILARLATAASGWVLPLEINQRGRVTAPPGLASDLARLIDDTLSEAGAVNGLTRELLANTFSSEQIQESMQRLFPMYPDGPVRVGESWGDSYSTPSSVRPCPGSASRPATPCRVPMRTP